MKHRVYRCCKQAVRQCQHRLALLVLLLVATLGAASVYGETEYNFSSVPSLVSGAPLSLGAVYRFKHVADGVDALVTIANMHNATVVEIDDSLQGTSAAFQPQIDSTESGGYVDFDIAFVAGGTDTQQAVFTVVSALDLNTVTEYDQFFSVSDFTIESDTVLDVSVEAPQVLTVNGGSIAFTSVSPLYTRAAVSLGVRNAKSFVYRVGTTSSSRRQASLLFSPLDFSDPVFTNINDSPQAQNDRDVVDFNSSLSVAAPGLLVNDSDIDNDTLSITHFQHGEKSLEAGNTAELPEGHLTVNADGSYRFLPAPNLSGSVTGVTYVVEDGKGGHDEAILDLSIRSEALPTDSRQLLLDEPAPIVAAVNVDEDENDDGWINSQELHGPVDISFILPENAIAGDSLRLSDGHSEKLFVVDSDVLVAGKVVASFVAPVDRGVIEIEATYLDAEGNLVLMMSDRAMIDLLPNAAPTVAIVADLDNSGFLSLQEHVELATVDIDLPASALVNDRVEIRAGTKVIDVVLAPLDIANGSLSIPITVPPEGSTLSVLVKIFDEAGNASDIASDSVVVDTVAPVPPVIDPLTTASSTPIITGGSPLGNDFILSVTVNGVVYASGDGDLLETGDGTWRLSIPELDALPNGIYDVQATLSDMAGNQSVDTTANELKVDLIVPNISVVSTGPVSDPAPLISGATDQEDLSQVRVVTVGNVFVCDALVEDSEWFCRSRITLPVGDTSLLASVSDRVGNSGSVEFSIVVVASSDQDADGIPDDVDGTDDADGDGLANYLDADSDNDTIADYIEGAIDSDGDQIRDFLDLDSDNDSLSDLYESGFSRLVDRDGTGTIDSSIIVGVNGLADVIETVKDSGESPLPEDSDNDGLPDFIDRDSDNDGIEDVAEQGIPESPEPSALPAMSDDPSSALRDAVDTDRDGIADYLDLDSDQDGVPDVIEENGVDADLDGRLDDSVDVNKDGISDHRSGNEYLDVDRDGVANQKDLDSDADGISDLIESGGVDANLDGIHDGWADQNANGISDDVDQFYTAGFDTDEDSIDDLYDADFVTEQDSDGDGIINSFDVDSDGNGRLDILDNAELVAIDSNRDGVPDMFEPELQPAISTGTGALGCSLNYSSRVALGDPTFLLMFFFAIVASSRRRLAQLSGLT